MPHAVVEWTDNLRSDGFEIDPLLQLIASQLRDSDGVFPIGGIRVRGIELSDYVVADGSGDDAFIHITIKIGAGRPAAFIETFFGKLFEAVSVSLNSVFGHRYLALSLYVEEAGSAASFKRNNLHGRFKEAR